MLNKDMFDSGSMEGEEGKSWWEAKKGSKSSEELQEAIVDNDRAMYLTDLDEALQSLLGTPINSKEAKDKGYTYRSYSAGYRTLVVETFNLSDRFNNKLFSNNGEDKLSTDVTDRAISDIYNLEPSEVDQLLLDFPLSNNPYNTLLSLLASSDGMEVTKVQETGEPTLTIFYQIEDTLVAMHPTDSDMRLEPGTYAYGLSVSYISSTVDTEWLATIVKTVQDPSSKPNAIFSL